MTTRPPISDEHSRAFRTIFVAMLIITALWSVWCIRAQLDTLGDEPAQLVVR
jgi:hypothetical protein